MNLTTNFTLEEMCASSTAKKYNISNTPNATYIQYLKELCNNVLQPIRDKFKQPIIVSSGYRCPQLNSKVGGAKNSDHLYGCAADIHTKSNTLADNKKLWDLIIQMKNDGIIKCRQIINEHNNLWIHISINNKYNSNKCNQILFT